MRRVPARTVKKDREVGEIKVLNSINELTNDYYANSH
jgi:hypothetical protein